MRTPDREIEKYHNELDAKIAQAHAAVDEAVELHEPSHKFALFSGGNDSLVMTHLLMERDDFDAVVHINTGIGIPETRSFVVGTALHYGWNLVVYYADRHERADGSPDPQVYEDLVLPPEVERGEMDPHERGGFPGPAMHQKMFDRLKGRQIGRLVRDHKQSHDDRILLASGVRSRESARRMPLASRGPINRNGAKLWVNPVLDWHKGHLVAYRQRHQLAENPVSKAICMSGECLCGAFAKPGELAEIKLISPETAERIEELEQRCYAAGYRHGWEGCPSEAWIMEGRGQMTLDQVAPDTMEEFQTCGKCYQRHYESEEE
jgi:3'-phosphoadenosine 5'-phosphosulfate sulfotransferase (PAPS reductase)/FAD synthetase